MDLVLKSAELGNQMPSEAELLSRAETWTELLFDITTDETELKPAYNRAFKDNKTDFPVNATMVKNAYERLREEIKYEAIKDNQANASDDFQCEFCFNSGWISIEKENGLLYSVPLKRNNFVNGVRKCHICDYWEKRTARIQK